MQNFYDAFLKWRSQAGMDNAIADRLSSLLSKAGLVDIAETPQHERTQRGDADFDTRIGIWADVASSRGHQVVKDHLIDEARRSAAEAEYRNWIREEAQSQSLYMIAVEGTRPS